MQLPSTPFTLQVGGGGEPLPLDELPPEEEPLLLDDDELLLDELLLDDDELLDGVQHSISAAPGQWPGVDTWPGIAAHALVAMQTPSAPFTEQLVGPLGEEPPKSFSAAWAWAMRFDDAHAPQIS